MTSASAMTRPSPTDEPGAPVAKDAIDPELIRLSRKPWRVGVITAAGVVVLSILFLLRLNGDRVFSGHGGPQPVTVQDIAAGRVEANSYVTVMAEPLTAHAVRASRTQSGVGFRVVPVRGAQDKLWLVVSGDGWETPNLGKYTGRLRPLRDLAFSDSMSEYALGHHRPLFATVAAVREAFGTQRLMTVTGETLPMSGTLPVEFDVIEPTRALVVCSFNERLPNATAWRDALARADLSPQPIAPGAGSPDQARFEVTSAGGSAEITSKLEKAELWAVRVEPITTHRKMPWADLVRSPQLDGVDLVGVYVGSGIAPGAFALVLGEDPQDYWYVLPITIALVLIALLFAWAFVRAVKRDLMSPSATS